MMSLAQPHDDPRDPRDPRAAAEEEQELAVARALLTVLEHAVASRDFAGAVDVAEQIAEHARRLSLIALRAKHL